MTTPTSGRGRVLDRALAAYPVLLAYLLLLILYAWQTTRHATPWNFTDELQWAEESRAVAHHGVLQVRGAHAAFSSLYPYVIAPGWWLSGTSGGYAAVKYINAAVMTASLFPAYALARLFVTRPAALAVGIATAAIPSLAYVGLLIPEPLAYFWSTLTLWLVARALVRRTRWAVAAAVVAVAIAPAVRSELAVLVVVAATATAIVALTGTRGRALVRSWSVPQRIAAAALALGVVIYLGAVVSHHSETWSTGTYYHHRMFEYGLWAVGAFTIGLGVLPVVVALAWLLGNRFRDERDRVVGGLLIGSTIAFGVYTAVKASKLSTVFAIRVEERNLIYLAPVVFLAVAVWAATGRVRVIALVAAAGAVAYLLDMTPYHNTEDFYSDAPGLSVLQWLNRKIYFTTTDARHLLFGILLGTLVVLAATNLLARKGRLGRFALPAGALLAVLVIGWNLWGEVAASEGSNRLSSSFRGVLPTPPDWIDRTTGGHRTMFIGQSLGGSNAFWSLEFWNQSMRDVWSADATAPGPGPTVTPDFVNTDGVVSPQLPLDWIVATPGIEPAGKLVATVGGLRLFRVPHPIRLQATTSGLSPDASWMSTAAQYVHFGPKTEHPGIATVSLSRAAACGGYPPSPITIRVTRLRINGERQPSPGPLLAERKVLMRSNPCDTRTETFRVEPPFRIDLTASRTFQPSATDQRQLSAQVGFGFRPS